MKGESPLSLILSLAYHPTFVHTTLPHLCVPRFCKCVVRHNFKTAFLFPKTFTSHIFYIFFVLENIHNTMDSTFYKEKTFLCYNFRFIKPPYDTIVQKETVHYKNSGDNDAWLVVHAHLCRMIWQSLIAEYGR